MIPYWVVETFIWFLVLTLMFPQVWSSSRKGFSGVLKGVSKAISAAIKLVLGIINEVILLLIYLLKKTTSVISSLFGRR